MDLTAEATADIETKMPWLTDHREKGIEGTLNAPDAALARRATLQFAVLGPGEPPTRQPLGMC